MKYCIYCGKEINDTAGFCPYCGKKQTKNAESREALADLEATAGTASEPLPADEPIGHVDPETQKKSKRGRLAAGILAVIVVGIFVSCIINGGNGSHASDEKALRKIIADQKELGAVIDEGAKYEWNEDGRLVGIDWSRCSLNGSISFSDLPCLERLDVETNQLSNLDVNGCRELKALDCSDNQLGKLDVHKNEKLKRLFCQNNTLNELNVKNCPGLKSLICYGNKLKTLDVSDSKDLEELECDESLAVSGCNAGIIQTYGYDE